MSYESMSDEDKILKAFDFVARGVPIPTVIAEFLVREGLYESIIKPMEITHDQPSPGVNSGYIGEVSGETGQVLLTGSIPVATLRQPR